MEYRYSIIRVSYGKVTNHIDSSFYGSYTSLCDALSDLTSYYHDLLRDLHQSVISSTIDTRHGSFTIETKYTIHQFDIHSINSLLTK